MIEVPAFDLNVPFGFDVARGTSSNSTRDTFLLPSRASPVKVTNKTVSFVNGEVSSLDKLGVTGCASKVHTPSQLAQVSSMGEAYILKYHIPFQIIFFVTSILQTVAIINFVMEFPDPFSNHKIRDGQLEIAPFSFKMIQEAWTAMTI
jgi:hypothetical protein